MVMIIIIIIIVISNLFYYPLLVVYSQPQYEYSQVGSKLIPDASGVAGTPYFGYSVDISYDGSVAVVGGPYDNSNIGAIWIYTMNSSRVWSQDGDKISPSTLTSRSLFGYSVSISADGRTVAVGAPYYNNSVGGVFIYSSVFGNWSQPANLLVGSGYVGTTIYQGWSVAICDDGNGVVFGGYYDNITVGAAWVFSKSSLNQKWYQVGKKLVGTGVAETNNPYQGLGYSLAISKNGSTIAIGGPYDNSSVGAVWVYTFDSSSLSFQQQGSKLVSSDNVGAALQGWSVALSEDGSKLFSGGPDDNSYRGAVWYFTCVSGIWSQQGSKLIANPSIANNYFGYSISVSSATNIPLLTVGGPHAYSNLGSGFLFAYNNSLNLFSQIGSSFVGTGSITQPYFGFSVAISGDGNKVIYGGYHDNNIGGAWIFKQEHVTDLFHINPLGVFANYYTNFTVSIPSNYGGSNIQYVAIGSQLFKIPCSTSTASNLNCLFNLPKNYLPLNSFAVGQLYIDNLKGYNLGNFSLFIAQEPIIDSISTNATVVPYLVVSPNVIVTVSFSQLSISDMIVGLKIDTITVTVSFSKNSSGIYNYSFLVPSLPITSNSIVPITVTVSSSSLNIVNFPLTNYNHTAVYAATPSISTCQSVFVISGIDKVVSITGSNFASNAQESTYCVILTSSSSLFDTFFPATILSSNLLTCDISWNDIGTFFLVITSTGLSSTYSNQLAFQVASSSGNPFQPQITSTNPTAMRVESDTELFIQGKNFGVTSNGNSSVYCVLNPSNDDPIVSLATNVSPTNLTCSFFWNSTLFGFQVPLAVSNNENPLDSLLLSNLLLITILPPCSVQKPGSILVDGNCLCSLGTQNAPTNNYCEPCPSGYYQDEIGSTSTCKLCPSDTGTNGHLGSTSIANCVCNADFFPDASSNCILCSYLKNRAICNGVNSTSSAIINTNNDGVIVNAGYWLSSKDKFFYSSKANEDYNPWFVIVPCPNSIACVGGKGEGNCLKGYKGVVCGDCEDGYGKLGSNTCSKCPSTVVSSFLVLFIFFLLILFCMTIVYFSSRSENNSDSTWLYLTFSIKIAINHLQILGFSGNFIHVWPEVLLKVFAIPTSAAQINSAAYNIAIDCLTHPSLYTRAIITFFLPLMIVTACGIGYLKDFHDRDNYLHKVKRSVVILLYVAHAGIVEGVFQAMVCHSVGGQSFALNDMKINCSSSSFKALRYFAIFYVISYGFGLLLLVYFLIQRNNHKQFFAFLTDGYKTELRFWEVITTLRKLILVIISLFASAPLQILLSQWVLALTAIINMRYRPYQVDIAYKLELVSLTTLIITISIGILFLFGTVDVNATDGTVVSFILIFLNFGAVAFVLYVGFSKFLSLRRNHNNENHDQDGKDETAVEMTDSNQQQEQHGTFYKKLLD